MATHTHTFRITNHIIIMTMDKVRRLQEMGFSEEQAVSALKLSNNVFEVAIGYLFGEPIDQPPPATVENKENTQIVPYKDTVGVSNPQDIPDLSLLGDSATNNVQWGNFEDDNLLDTYENEYVENNGDNDDNDDDDEDDGVPVNNHYPRQDSPETAFDFPAGFLREQGGVPAVLPSELSRPQSRILALLVVLSQIESLREVIFSKKFDYEFDENWFTPKVSNEDDNDEVSEEEQDKENLYRFVVEVQRIFGFLSPVSKRAFISGDSLCKVIPDDYEDDIWEDAIKKVQLLLSLGSKNVLEKDITTYFENEVECNDEERTGLTVLQMDYDTRGSNLQEGLDTLFWESELRPVFTKVAPYLTIQLYNDEDVYQSQQFEVPEYFYPGVYSDTYQPLITKMNHKRLNAHKERSSITTKLLSLSSFEGKKIKKIIQNSVDYLATTEETAAHDDLRNLSEKMKDETNALNERIRIVGQDYSKMDTKNHANILQEIENEGLELPEKYVLTGVVISDNEYFYKTKQLSQYEKEEWVFTTIDSVYGKVSDYRTETMNFDAVQSFVLEETKVNNRQLVLFYTAESYTKGNAEIPDTLAEFFAKDNELLENQAEERTSTSETQEMELDDEEEEEVKSDTNLEDESSVTS
ncbi:hypothetical protein G210_3135 [Candida maltosa Xu316]|uniref:UBA domain-containing protein n=1 Tax=Candida maltosa (strain Xu316) TaxID=1245528 RepID=M3IJR8_CANMX|nr:hypothetical protein G210_3135 [Candida maltosa Xu316]